MIQASVICFNDTPELIDRCLKSVALQCDIKVIDGAYATYPHDNPRSTDGTIEKAKEYTDDVIVRGNMSDGVDTPEAWRSQVDKRNAYLTLKSNKDYYLVIDTDEYLEGEIPELKDDFYAIPVITNGNIDYQVRLFRHQEGLKYKKKHSWIWLKGQCISMDISNPNIVKLDTIKIIHTPELRSAKKQLEDYKYLKERQDNQTEPESLKDYLTPMPEVDGVLMLALEFYSGFDNSKSMTVQANQEFMCSEGKAKQLLEDFPKLFKRI